MSLYLSQLITPEPTAYWRNYILQALQGIGYVTQSAQSNQIQGTGTVTPSGPATQASSVVVDITTSGNVGVGFFKYSTDGGVTFSSPVLIPSGATSTAGSYLIATIGVTITFTNGSYYSPNQTNNSFVSGEQYGFSTFVPTFPITNWEPGAPSFSLIQADAQALADFSLTQAQVAAGGLTQSWITPPPWGPPPSGWLDILSQNFYNRFRIQGGYATGIVQLVNSGAGSQTINPGAMLFQSATGQQFTNKSGGTLTGSGTLNVTIQAANTGASYNNVPTNTAASITSPLPIPGGNYITTIVSPTLPGVAVWNPINSSPACITSGGGVGAITFTGTATSAFSVIFQINMGGALGVSTYSYSLDGGNTYTFEGVTVSTGVVLNGMTVVFPPGTYDLGTLYAFSTGWITNYGSDTQSNLSLATADQNQWTQLAPSSPAGTYSNWAEAASPEVTKVFVQQSATVPGQVDLLLVGQNNSPVSAAAVLAVQSYIVPRLGIDDSVLTSTVIPVTVAVTAGTGGTININTSQAASVYAGVAAALYALQISIPPGGTLFQSAVIAAIQGVPGVIDIVEPIWLNGALVPSVPLAPNEVVVITPPPSTSYTLL